MCENLHRSSKSRDWPWRQNPKASGSHHALLRVQNLRQGHDAERKIQRIGARIKMSVEFSNESRSRIGPRRFAPRTGSDSLATIPPTSPSAVGGRGTDKKKKCRIVAGFRIKPPKMKGDRYTVQARSAAGRWTTQITTSDADFALEWVKSRSPNAPDQLSGDSNQKPK